MEKMLIIGCGDIGTRVARLAKRENAAVTTLVRSKEAAGKLESLAITTMIGNLDEPATFPTLPTRGSIILYSVPPPGGGFSDPRIRVFCRSIPAEAMPKAVIYLSTSGVYGNCGDTLVTEETLPNPGTSRGRRRLDAEQTLQQWGREQGVAVIILRVTGIYGPGRFPVSQLEAGHPLLDEQESPMTNRIHADDLAGICIAAALHGKDGDVFNVCDDQPSTMTHYFNSVADALGYPRPRQISLAEAKQVMSPLMLSYISESRRMDNRKMKERLGIRLLYPNLEAGLAALHL